MGTKSYYKKLSTQSVRQNTTQRYTYALVHKTRRTMRCLPDPRFVIILSSSCQHSIHSFYTVSILAAVESNPPAAVSSLLISGLINLCACFLVNAFSVAICLGLRLFLYL